MPTSAAPRDDEALATSVVAFLVAGLIFTGSIGAVLIMSRNSTGGVAASNAPAAALKGEAKSLAQLLLDSPGYASNGGDWVSGAPPAAGTSPFADGLARLGLKDGLSSDPSMLNYSKFQNLRRAPYAASGTDGYVNYQDARVGLGLDKAGLDFHIRAYPSLLNITQILAHGYQDPNLRVTYVGNIGVSNGGSPPPPPPSGPTAGLTASTPACWVSPLPDSYRINSTITNGGQTDTQFSASWTINLNGQGSKSYYSNSLLVPHGQSGEVRIDIPAYGSKTCAASTTTIALAISDPSKTLLTLPTSAPSPGSTAAAVSPKDLTMEVSKPFYTITSGTCASGGYLNYDGSNLVDPHGHTAGDQVVARIFSGTFTGLASGSPVWTSVVPTANPDNSAADVPSSTNQRQISFPCLTAGTYTVFLYLTNTGSSTTDYDHAIQVRKTFLVVTSAPANYLAPAAPPPPPPSGTNSYTPTTAVALEVGFLRTLVSKFCPTYFDSTTLTPLLPAGAADWNGDGLVNANDDWAHRCAFEGARTPGQPGDVFPDDKQIMNNEQTGLRARLIDVTTGKPRYDIANILVVGSTVDQNSMTSAAAKDAVRDWVLGGGTLIAFGSDAQNVNWLEPLFHAAIRSSSGGLGTPDPSNAVLHSSDELDYPHYSNGNRVWAFNGQTAQDAALLFDNVVVQGADPVTTLSNPGAFGDGRVILTTWMPYEVYGGARDAATTQLEGTKLLHNLLVQGYQNLFLDYGPPLPSHINVIPAVRYAQINDPEFTDPIQLSVDVFVFK